MRYKRLSFLLLTSPLLHTAVFSQPSNCESSHHINRVTIRHIESKGIGYNTGYTTLEGFFVPLSSLSTKWIPFLDVRGHIFNNSKPAANAGIGLRYVDNRVWGGNIYYDYKKTSHHNYNQVSFGLESLGRYVDYRVNGYFPVGSDKSSLYNPQFYKFSGHSLYIARKQELALKGGNGEIGVHIAKIKGIDFYTALGPYYFGNGQKHTLGGEFRVAMDFLGILRLEGNTSYDHLYKWIGQGQISLSYAFAPKTMKRTQKKGSCSYNTLVRDRAFQRVDKQEIIVTSTQQKKNVAINPATGLPYTFWFVDNTSHSQGTWESPFNTLTNAQNASSVNDIIVVLPGDGTDTGMSSGITLKNGQKLWGTSVPHVLSTSLGDIKIKPLANQLPVLSNTNAGGNAVVTAGNDNSICGIKINDTTGNNGIYINGKSGSYLIENNIVFVSNGNNNNGGMFFNNSYINAQIINNSLIALDHSQTVGIAINTCSGDFIVDNNILSGIDTQSGFFLGIAVNYNQNSLKGSITNNKLDFTSKAQNAAIGIRVGYLAAATDTAIFVANNHINNIYFGITRLLNAGIGVQLGGSIFTTLRNNKVSTLDMIKMPAYNFQNKGGASFSQINFGPDNTGNFISSGF